MDMFYQDDVPFIEDEGRFTFYYSKPTNAGTGNQMPIRSFNATKVLDFKTVEQALYPCWEGIQM